MGRQGEGKREGKLRDLLLLAILTSFFRSGVSKLQAVCKCGHHLFYIVYKLRVVSTIFNSWRKTSAIECVTPRRDADIKNRPG